MKIQSITPTENLYSNNRSFKATFVSNKLFRELCPDSPHNKHRVYSMMYERFASVSDKFTSMNKGHVIEILRVTPKESGFTEAEVLNRSNGIKATYSWQGWWADYKLTELIEKIIRDKKIFNMPQAESVSENITQKELPMFVADEKGVYAKLLETVENDSEFNKCLKKRNRRGHSLEIISSANFRHHDSQHSSYSKYTIFNHRTGATSGYKVEGDGEFKNLIKQIINDKHLFNTKTGHAKRFMKLTGQK